MEYKFPKTISIDSIEFDMRYDKNYSGAEFSYPDDKNRGYIEIGTQIIKTSPSFFLELLIHELKEIIQIQQSTRYYRPDESRSYEFHYTHKEHTDMCTRLAGLLTNFIK